VKNRRLDHFFWAVFAAATTMVAICRPASATIVDTRSTGTELSTAVLSVKFKTAGVKSTLVQSGPAVEQGSANLAGFFSFSVTGETFLNRWILRNLTTSDFIESAVFDLTTTSALFDDGSMPDTPNGDVGRKGISLPEGAIPTNSFEHVRWTDPMNKGDEYLKETLEWAPNTFGPGMFCTWNDDTDDYVRVPEPAALALIGLGAVGLQCARRDSGSSRRDRPPASC